MQADPNNKALDALKAWIGELACPACVGALRLNEATVTCTVCGRIYPLVDGIPVLIVERAEQKI
jgi:uncharacterized protein YbaR (Trm112 family)